jgi:hypothetical protein
VQNKIFDSIKTGTYFFIVVLAIIAVRHSFFQKKEIKTKVIFNLDREGKILVDDQRGEYFRLYMIDVGTKQISLNNRKAVYEVNGTVVRKRFMRRGIALQYIPSSKIQFKKTCWYILGDLLLSILICVTHLLIIQHTSQKRGVFAYI